MVEGIATMILFQHCWFKSNSALCTFKSWPICNKIPKSAYPWTAQSNLPCLDLITRWSSNINQTLKWSSSSFRSYLWHECDNIKALLANLIAPKLSLWTELSLIGYSGEVSALGCMWRKNSNEYTITCLYFHSAYLNLFLLNQLLTAGLIMIPRPVITVIVHDFPPSVTKAGNEHICWSCAYTTSLRVTLLNIW